jgi:hypothetical protein
MSNNNDNDKKRFNRKEGWIEYRCSKCDSNCKPTYAISATTAAASDACVRGVWGNAQIMTNDSCDTPNARARTYSRQISIKVGEPSFAI